MTIVTGGDDEEVGTWKSNRKCVSYSCGSRMNRGGSRRNRGLLRVQSR
jgi:hypothetical protein